MGSQLQPFPEWNDVEVLPDQVKRLWFGEDYFVVHRVTMDVLGQIRSFSVGLVRETPQGDAEVARYCTEHERLHVHQPNTESAVLMEIESAVDVERAYHRMNTVAWSLFETLVLR